jgi:hypothetical protein
VRLLESDLPPGHRLLHARIPCNLMIAPLTPFASIATVIRRAH